MSVAASSRGYEQPIPHPILDNPSKMMRLIANPVYDRLTLSRAANVRKYNPTNPIQQALQLQRAKETAELSSFKGSDTDETTIMPIPNPQELGMNRSRSKSTARIQVLLPPSLRASLASNQNAQRSATPGSHSRISTAHSRSTTARTRATTARSRSRATPVHLTVQSIQDELIADTAKIPKPTPAGTTRYVNTRHGFEVQHYSSRNWLSTDVYTKETCQDHEQTFRDILERKRLHERLSRNIYSSEYYSNRLNELLQSYKQGHLSHTEWAKQSYQLHFLKTLYIQALKREQREKHDHDIDADNPSLIPLTESKETKNDDNSEHHNNRMHTPFSHNTTDEASFLSTNSFTLPISSITDENNSPLPNKSRLMSISIHDDREFHRATNNRPVTSSKNTSTVSASKTKSNVFLMLDEQRWSLQAMVKRVVGLAEKLPSPPNYTDGKQSRMTTNTNTDCDIE